jgi:hypothetical protein
MKFVLVNGRTPRTQTLCGLCCEPIGESYLRDIVTWLPYCNHKCYVDHVPQIATFTGMNLRPRLASSGMQSRAAPDY